MLRAICGRWASFVGTGSFVGHCVAVVGCGVIGCGVVGCVVFEPENVDEQ